MDELEFLRTVTRYMTVAYERLRLVRELREADRKKDDFIALFGARAAQSAGAAAQPGCTSCAWPPTTPPPCARAARESMERQLSHMCGLIDDLLDISRISLNKLQLRRSRVALSKSCRTPSKRRGPSSTARASAGGELAERARAARR